MASTASKGAELKGNSFAIDIKTAAAIDQYNRRSKHASYILRISVVSHPYVIAHVKINFFLSICLPNGPERSYIAV